MGERLARRRVPFVAHELAEYTIGAALIATGTHLTGGIEPEFIFAGSMLVGLNLVSKGRLGAAKILGRGLHHVADVIVIVILAAAPSVGFVRHDLRAVLVTEALALLLVFIEQSTRYREMPTPQRTVIDARATKPSSGTAPVRGALGPSVRRSARRLGVFAGVTKKVVRENRDTNRQGARAKS